MHVLKETPIHIYQKFYHFNTGIKKFQVRIVHVIATIIIIIPKNALITIIINVVEVQKAVKLMDVMVYIVVKEDPIVMEPFAHGIMGAQNLIVVIKNNT